MANWSGTFTITTPGTTVTSAGASTLTNTGAAWPTGAQSLANFTIRILTGVGAGQERVVLSNTATVITTTTPWTTIPAAGDTYEIVALLKNSDHFVGNTSFSTNTIVEFEDSANFYFDGTYTLNFLNSCAVRGLKTLATMITFQANNRLIQGRHGFWSYVNFQPTLSITPQVQFWKCLDCSYGLYVAPSAGAGNGSTIKYLWSQFTTTASFAIAPGAQSQNMAISNVFNRYGTQGAFLGNSTSNAFSMTLSKFWSERCISGGVSWGATTGCAAVTVDNSVFKESYSNRNININAGRTGTISNCYISAPAPAIIIGGSSVAAAGTYTLDSNTIFTTRCVYGNAISTATVAATKNDMISRVGDLFEAFDLIAAAYTSATSDQDYLAGHNGATIDNVDTTASTTSTATPVQYQNLTAARTNPRSVRNKPLTMDNVSVGVPTDTQVVVTADCAAGTTSLRHTALAFVEYGTVSGVYNMRTDLPSEEDYGLIFTEINQTYAGNTYQFKQTAHSVTLKHLAPSTTYYAKFKGRNPLGETLESAEFSFTTAPSSRYTNPGTGNVAAGIGYLYDNSPLTGTLPTLPGSGEAGINLGSFGLD